MSLEESKQSLMRKHELEAHAKADEAPNAEMREALLSAQDDLQSKAEEANGLASKVARLEHALSQLV